ncbi:MAG: hypothetical protein ACREYC_23540, partial [Gammaproteobacteria bacterium]
SRMAAPSTTGSATDPNFKRRVVEQGKQLLAAARGEAEGARPVDRWLERLLQRVMEDEGFRVQALRFAVFDAYPYSFLWIILSIEAILITSFVLTSRTARTPTKTGAPSSITRSM